MIIYDIRPPQKRRAVNTLNLRKRNQVVAVPKINRNLQRFFAVVLIFLLAVPFGVWPAKKARAADTTLYVNTASTAGGDCTTNSTDGGDAHRACATLSAAEALLPANITAAGSNGIYTIVAEGQAADTAAVTFSGTVTDATHYIVVTTNPLATYGRHDGKWNTNKYRLEVANGTVVDIRDDFVRIDGLQISKTSSSADNQAGIYSTGVNAGSDIRISNTIIKQAGNASYNEPGILSQGPNVNLNIWNTLIYGLGAKVSSSNSGITSTAANTIKIYSSTIIGGYRGVFRDTSGTWTAKNTYARGVGSGFGGTITKTNCASSDTSADGTAPQTNIALNTTNFTNVTAGSEDFHLPLGSALIVVGTNTSGESEPFNFTTDIDGQTRIGTWDIGADEYIAADLTNPTPGDSGTITTANITSTSLTLNWTKGTDNVSAPETLQYRIYQSSSSNIDTVTNIEANGTPLNAYTTDINTLPVTSLSPSTTYYFNIIIKDEAGNKAAYTTKSEITSAEPALNTYWVSPTGVAAWVNCKSDTPLSGTAACSYTTANTNANAGDTVYYRGGTYGGITGSAINPTNTGTAGNIITFSAYNNEDVEFVGSGTSSFAVNLNSDTGTVRSYIKVNDLHFTDFMRYLWILKGTHNEISNSSFIGYPATATQSDFAEIFQASYIYRQAQYNWIHDNIFGKWGYNADFGYDTGGVFGMGLESSTNDLTRYNLVENNEMYSGGHHVAYLNGSYNVYRNNYFHNEPWYPLDVPVFSTRVVAQEGYAEIDGIHNLNEGNRIGYGGPKNKNELGGNTTQIKGAYNIWRNNIWLQSYLSAVLLENYGGGQTTTRYNKIYNNVFWHGGYGQYQRWPDGTAPSNSWDDGYTHPMWVIEGASGTDVYDNVIKNNIFYQNEDDLGTQYSVFARYYDAGLGWVNQIPQHQILSNNYLDNAGDPKFTDITGTPDPTDSTQFDFRLQSDSPAIDNGAFLTTITSASGSDTSFTVDDAGYFFYPYGGMNTEISGATITGDSIQLEGRGSTATITNIDYDTNTITVDTPLIWENGQAVALAYRGSAPDQGAYEYITASTYAIAGTISGLSDSVTLQNNSSNDLTLTSNGTFQFSTLLANSASYAVTVLSQPTNQTCSISNGSGTISSADVTNVSVVCTTNSTPTPTPASSGGGGGGSPAIWTLPTVPSSGFKLIINGGVLTTSNRNVLLGFNAGTDIKKMAISMTGDFTDASQEDYAASKQWDLCSRLGGTVKNPTCPDRTYTVYVKFYTAYGRSSDAATVSSSIVLDSNFINPLSEVTTGTTNQSQQNQPQQPFTKPLRYGMYDADVKRLQQFLNLDPDTRLDNKWVGSPGKETNFFGPKTWAAVRRFQEKYGKDVLSPWGLIRGTGFVGKTTLAKINELISKIISQ